MHRKVKVMQIKSYDNHIDLIGFYKENGLEFDEDFNYISSPLFSYVIQDKGEIIGAITCSKIDNNFIIEAVAVNEKYRKSGMGKKLVIRAINKMKNNTWVDLVAKIRIGYHQVYGSKGPILTAVSIHPTKAAAQEVATFY